MKIARSRVWDGLKAMEAKQQDRFSSCCRTEEG